MTQQDSVALIERYFAAFNAQDWDGLTECLSPDVKHHVNQGSVREGLEKFALFLRHMDACYAENISDLVAMANPDGSRAAAEFTVSGTYRKTDAGMPEAKGQKYKLPAGSFFEIESGKITRVTTYYNLEDWKRQVEER